MVSKKFRVESLQSEEEENTLILVFDTKNTLGPTYLNGLFSEFQIIVHMICYHLNIQVLCPLPLRLLFLHSRCLEKIFSNPYAVYTLLLCLDLIAVSYRYFKLSAKDHPCKIIKNVRKYFLQDFEVIKSEEYDLHYSKHQKSLLLCQINIAVFLKIEPSSVQILHYMHILQETQRVGVKMEKQLKIKYINQQWLQEKKINI